MQYKGLWSNRPAFSKLTIITALAIAGFAISSLVAFVLMKVIFNLNVISNPNLLSDFSNPVTIDALKFLQMCNAIGFFILPPLVYSYLASDNIGSNLRLNKSPKILQLLLAGASMIIAIPLINWMAQLNSQMHLPKFMSGVELWMKQSEESATRVTNLFLNVNSSTGLIYNLFLIAFLPAFGEELIFRGALQPLLKEQTKSKIAGIILTGILFSAIHMQFYGFLPRMMMGVYFGFLILWTQNLWVPVFAHFVNNGFAVLASYYYGSSSGVENAGIEEGGIIYLLGSILGFGAITYWFYHQRTKQL